MNEAETRAEHIEPALKGLEATLFTIDSRFQTPPVRNRDIKKPTTLT